MGILRTGWDDSLKRLDAGIDAAEIATINDTSVFAADLDRAQVRKIMTLRTRWTEGSIYPKHNSRAGLIPSTKKSSMGAYVRVGSLQQYMADQDAGWIQRDPYVPTDEARVGKNKKRKIRRPDHLRNIEKKGMMTAKNFRQPRTRKAKINAMIGMVRNSKNVGGKGYYKGVIRVMPGDPTTLPPGYYRVNRRKSLKLVRLAQQGPKRRAGTHWHTKTMKNPAIPRREQMFFTRHAARMMRRVR